jgi:hypothetical protein
MVKEGAITSDKFHPKICKKEELLHTLFSKNIFYYIQIP